MAKNKNYGYLSGNNLGYTNKEEKRSRRRLPVTESLLKLYAAIGVAIAVAGVTYSTFIILDIQLSPELQRGLLITASGLLLTGGSLGALFWVQQQQTESFQETQVNLARLEILSYWKKFEDVATRLVSIEGDRPTPSSIRHIIEKLFQQKKLDEEEFEILRVALNFRNQVAHGGDSSELEAQSIEGVLNPLRMIINRLEEQEEIIQSGNNFDRVSK